MEDLFNLDDQARLALDVAQHAAAANGDSHCGTEYLLYGLVATARGELVELTELFALNVLRVDRAIDRLVEDRTLNGVAETGGMLLSLRARAALSTPRLDGQGPTGTFELLHGLLIDDDSGACTVLRYLGVQPEEARRLVAYGLRHLSQQEVDELISTLDRRTDNHRSWWGPSTSTRLRSRPVLGTASQIVAQSESAMVELTAIGADGNGFGFTLTTRSLRSWVLPPLFLPTESLIPGLGSQFVDGPDFFLVQVVTSQGVVLDNRQIHERFAPHEPGEARMVRLGQRDERTELDDRRSHDLHVVTTDWWLWPLPGRGSVELRVDWPAEAISGTTSFDGAKLSPAPEIAG